MSAWLNLPQDAYLADVCWFAQKLPPGVVLEAVEIARDKIPAGGWNGFKYFCGVCHRKREILTIQRALDNES